MGNPFGQQVNPITPNPTIGTSNQNNFFQSLFNAGMNQGPDQAFRFSGVPGYGGQLSPDMSSTILPNVYKSWQPMDAGTMYTANALYNPASQGFIAPGQQDPRLAMLMQQGGTGGPGHQAQAATMAYGGPSPDIAQWMHSLAQFGSAGPAGTPLNNLAQGYATGPAQYMMPFLTRGSSQPYKAPNIPSIGRA